MIYTQKCATPLGRALLASEGESLCGLWFEGQRHFMRGVKAEKTEEKRLAVFEAAEDWLERYFRGERPLTKELPLSPKGSAFAREVWGMLLDIPYGKLTSYGTLAALYAQRHGLASMSAQAVGGAVGRNPVSIIIPCHRVLAASGSLTGYAGGLDKKLALLELEGIDPLHAGEYWHRF